jgi:retron-type reverse transcriptase
VISEAQNGFRENKSTNTATQTFIEDIQKALDNRLLVMCIFLDLTKAFDVINHKLLLAKLEHYGLRGIIYLWMSSYLTDRTQFVEIQQIDEKTSNLKTYTSSCKEIKYGLPQGSVLGPLLFLLYINDLPQSVQEAKVVLFADDTNILLIEKNLVSLQDKIVNL